jgi:predicted transcriptional regulator
MDVKTRKANATKEARKLTKIFSEVLDGDEMTKAAGLIENAAFMRVSLKELQINLQENGFVETYQNGENQSGMKDSSYLRAYNNLYKSYSATMKQLFALAPAAKAEVDDGFDAL